MICQRVVAAGALVMSVGAGGQCPPATDISATGRGSGMLIAPDQPSWFSFHVQARHSYEPWFEGTGAAAEVFVDAFLGDCATYAVEHRYASTRFTALTDGTAYLRVRPGSAPPGSSPYVCGFNDLGPTDDSEPSATPGAPLILADGGWTTSRIDYDGDSDVFRVVLRPHTVYRVEAERIDPATGVFVEAFDPADPAGLVGGAGVSAYGDGQPVFLAAASGDGPVELAIRVSSDSTGSIVGDYRLRVSTIGRFPDAVPAADCASAHDVGLGLTVIGVVARTGVEQWHRFHLAPHHRYRGRVIGGGPGVSMSTDVAVGGCDNRVVQQTYANEFLVYSDSHDEIRVGVTVDYWSGIAPYQIALTDLGAVSDDWPAGPADAALIAADGTPVAGSIDAAGDTDTFRLDVSAGTWYRVRLEQLSGSYAQLELVDAGTGGWIAGLTTVVAEDYPAGRVAEGRAYVRADGAPSCLVRMTGFGRVLPAYRFSIWREEPEPDDQYGGDCGHAAPLAINGPAARPLINTRLDEDWFRADLPADRIIRVDVADRSLGSSFNFVAYGPACGTVHPSSLDSSHIRDFESGAGGAFWIRVAGRGACTLRLLDLGPATDTETDSPAAAPTITVNGTLVRGVVDEEADIDAYRVHLRAGVPYTLQGRLGERGESFLAWITPVADNRREAILRAGGTWPPTPHDRWQASDGNFTPTIGGEYIVRVGANYDRLVTDYQLRVVDTHCPADRDGSGTLDAADLYSFLDDYLSWSPGSEFDLAGLHGAPPGVDDLLAFITAFILGCR